MFEFGASHKQIGRQSNGADDYPFMVPQMQLSGRQPLAQDTSAEGSRKPVFWRTPGSPTIGQLIFERAVANNGGERSKSVWLSRPSCMTDKGARVALALCGPLQGMVQPPARNASRPPWLKALCRWRICRVA